MEYLILFLCGAFIGSYLNVCVHRLPRNESVVHPPSRCYGCGTHVQWYDNIPLISYLVLRGRCRWCGIKFSPRYMIMELVVGLITAVVGYFYFNPIGGESAPMWGHHSALGILWSPGEPWLVMLHLGFLLAIVYTLYVASWIDKDFLIINDEISMPLQFIAPVIGVVLMPMLPSSLNMQPALMMLVDGRGNWHQPGFWDLFICMILTLVILAASLPLAKLVYSKFAAAGQEWREEDHRGFRFGVFWFIGVSIIHLAILFFVSLQAEMDLRWASLSLILSQSVLGSLTGWMSLYVVGLVGTAVFRRNAMGFGDVKILAPIGAIVGPLGVFMVIGIASLLGVIVGLPLRLMGQREIPFGPYLALGCLVVLFAGNALLGVVLPGLSS